MIIDERYKKEYVPEDPTGNKKLSIQLWFDVIDIVEINEPEVSKRVKMKTVFNYSEIFVIADVIFSEVQCLVEMD